MMLTSHGYAGISFTDRADRLGHLEMSLYNNTKEITVEVSKILPGIIKKSKF